MDQGGAAMKRKTDNEAIDAFIYNVDAERQRLGMTQQTFAEAIGMSYSSYKRFLRNEMNMNATLVMRNLYYLTGKCAHELMQEEDDQLRVRSKVGKLGPDQLAFIEGIIDHELGKK